MSRVHRLVWLAIMALLVVAANASATEVLRYAGATTLQRFFMPEIANVFSSDTAIKINIEGGNTGPGIRALINGDVDMAGAGRFLTTAEKKQGLVEHFLGWDALAVIVHEQNKVESLTLPQLQALFSGETTNWQDLGGSPGPVVVVSCPKGSGMRSAVKKLILHDKQFLDREIVSAVVAEADQQASMFPGSITVLSRSMLDAGQVKTVKVEGVPLTDADVVEGRYPLVKPLLLVTRGEPRDDLARFMDLVKSAQGKAILQKKFVPAE